MAYPLKSSVRLAEYLGLSLRGGGSDGQDAGKVDRNCSARKPAGGVRGLVTQPQLSALCSVELAL